MFPLEENTDERFLKSITVNKNETWKVLRRGGFFGPNASGKSSFIGSIAFARNLIVNGRKTDRGTRINQFKGDFDDLKGISKFQFVFYHDESVYEYGFSIDRQQIHEEWLMQVVADGFVPLFTRVTDKYGKTMIDIENDFAPESEDDRKLSEVLKLGMQESQKNQLFLYKLCDNGVKRAESIAKWFENLRVILPNSSIRSLPLRMGKNEDFQAFIAEMLRAVDTGVDNIASEKMSPHDFVEKMDIEEEELEKIEGISSGTLRIRGKRFGFSEEEKGLVFFRQKFKHVLNGKTVSFDADDESDGTQRLLDLLPMLYFIRENNNLVFFVDEIDRSLHTKITQFLLDEFVKCCDKTNNQIIFTAHDVNLINTDSFRQEEIWFIEKNSLGESQLRPLSDFDLKEGQDTLKGYLNGRFGGIPTIRRGV